MALFAMLLMSFVPAAFFYLIFRPDGIEDWAKEQEKIDSYLRQAMQNPQADFSFGYLARMTRMRPPWLWSLS